MISIAQQDNRCHPRRPGSARGQKNWCSKTRLGLFLAAASLSPIVIATVAIEAYAQAPAAARQIGIVKGVTPGKLTINTDAGKSISVDVAEGAKVLQLSPGSTDLKAAQTIRLEDIEVGDRVLVSGHQDAADAMTVSRVILMKSTDIAQKNEAQQADWQKRGMEGLVSAVDANSGTITVSTRGKKVAIETQSSTVYRRYAGGSVKFSDAVTGTMDQIQVGDQLRARGDKAADGSSIKAEEVVTGAFENLAGKVTAVDAAAQTFSLSDIGSTKTYSIKLTANSSVRALPPEAAARFAARAKGEAATSQSPGSTDRAKSAQASGATSGDAHSAPRGEGGGSAGMDLSQLVNRLPQGSLNDLHVGEVLMVVAEKSTSGGDGLTAVTVLSGVEPILTATPKGSASMTLSPWNMGSAEGAGASQ